MPRSALPCLLTVLAAAGAQAQSLEISWWTIDSGVAPGAGATLSIAATLGQPDAGTLPGATLSVAGGFWADLSPCPGDFNGDSTVDTRDFIAFLNAWVALDPRSDANHDGSIDSRDVITFLNAWTQPCP
ncbi:MAG: hypothetical protein IPJ41_07095 [Phycisphaerales bacterium]|nr:hypothetical protein [Phycisphaerales bacterium]